MIGNMVEYTGLYNILRGQTGIVVEEVPTIFRHCGSTWKIMWTTPVNFAGRRVPHSIVSDTEFIILSEVQL
jgi:hypothetical protein